LVHCRGGVGRAGLIACCWMLKMGLCGWIRRMEFPPLEHPFQSFFDNNALEASPDLVNGNADPIGPPSNGTLSAPPWPQNGSTSNHSNSTADSNQPRESSPEKRPNGIPHTLALVRLDTMDLVERAIRVVRRRRSVKAIETFEQVHFLVQFVEFLRGTPIPHSSGAEQR
jgi:hypothetical protein